MARGLGIRSAAHDESKGSLFPTKRQREKNAENWLTNLYTNRSKRAGEPSSGGVGCVCPDETLVPDKTQDVAVHVSIIDERRPRNRFSTGQRSMTRAQHAKKQSDALDTIYLPKTKTPPHS